MVIWEFNYMIISSNDNYAVRESEMNIRGSDGWKLIESLEAGNLLILMFRRDARLYR